MRRIPSVESVLNFPDVVSLCAQHGRSVVTDWVRDVLSAIRTNQSTELSTDASRVMADIVDQLCQSASREISQRLRQVINGTGVVIHTNLGRAPLADAAIQAITATACGTNLEID